MTKDLQYATALRSKDGELFDFYPEDGYVDLVEAIRAAQEWNDEEAESDDTCVVVSRVAPVPAGEWKLARVAGTKPGKEAA